ncbi:FAD-dependent oxidoreductase [Streptomyces sp. NPDC057582]|uniref:FAD-dependent oxidoreductase n=1 Tax=Streptomyces sp. NPDC057582 TaxID=3346174 RepID=UPI0036822880
MSKQLLLGTGAPGDTALRPDGHLRRLGVELHLGRRAVALDPVARTLILDDGTPLAYTGVVIATGARPRRIPEVPDRAGVHVLRSLDDALALRTALEARPRVVVAGEVSSGWRSPRPRAPWAARSRCSSRCGRR